MCPESASPREGAPRARRFALDPAELDVERVRLPREPVLDGARDALAAALAV